MNNGKSFSKITKPTERDGAYYLKFDFRNCCRLMRDWKLESLQNGKDILPLRSERKKRFTSGGTLNLWSDFPQKFLFHFTFNRNFRIILLNGKHPNFPENLFTNFILPTDGSPLFPFRTEQWKFPDHLLNLPLSSLSYDENNCKW